MQINERADLAAACVDRIKPNNLVLRSLLTDLFSIDACVGIVVLRGLEQLLQNVAEEHVFDMLCSIFGIDLLFRLLKFENVTVRMPTSGSGWPSQNRQRQNQNSLKEIYDEPLL